MRRPYVYQTMAVLNLLFQSLPALACPFLRRRPMQVLAAEAIGLHMIMDLFGWEMLPLAVLFINWDRLSGELSALRARGWLLLGWITILIAYQAGTAWTMSDLDNRNYPFSSAPLYSVRYGPEHWRTRFDTVPTLVSEARRRMMYNYSAGIHADHFEASRLAADRIERIVAEVESRWAQRLESVTAVAVKWKFVTDSLEPIEVERKPLADWKREESPPRREDGP